MIKAFISPASLLVGTTIGAGIFSLPYVFAKSGLFLGILYLIVLSAVAFIIHLLYADIVVRTYESRHRFPGYAKMYLGKYGESFANFIVFTTLILILTVYLILSVSFTGLIFPQIPEYFKIFIFWILGSITLLLGIKKEVFFESFTTALTIFIIFVVFGFGFFSRAPQVFHLPIIDMKNFFLPLGPVLFSLIAPTSIPPLVVYFKNENLDVSRIKKIVFWGTILPALFYLLFVLGISWLSQNISQDSVSGLIGYVKPLFLTLLGVFGFVSLWDSYASVGEDIRKIIKYDWNLSAITGIIIVLFAPLALYFLGLQNFLKLVGFVGGVLMAVWSLLIIAIWVKARRKECPQKILDKINLPLIYLVVIILMGAIAYEIISFV